MRSPGDNSSTSTKDGCSLCPPQTIPRPHSLTSPGAHNHSFLPILLDSVVTRNITERIPIPNLSSPEMGCRGPRPTLRWAHRPRPAVHQTKADMNPDEQQFLNDRTRSKAARQRQGALARPLADRLLCAPPAVTQYDRLRQGPEFSEGPQ